MPVVLVATMAGVAPLVAQTPTDSARIVEQLLGQGTSHADIVQALRDSGLPRSQLRSRLQQLGYDPGLADRYYDLVEGGGDAPIGGAPDSLTRALGEVGIVLRPEPDDPYARLDSLAMDTLGIDTQSVDSLAPGELPIFGMDLFRRATNQFQAILTGPVDTDYRLGPGDQLFLLLTGDVETSHVLDVTREGFVFIPSVGQILVNGLTMRQLEDRLYDRLGQVYSGVSRAPGATTQFQATLGELRSNQIFVIGEVERPGAYTLSSVATVLTALYAARGPSRNGSFRRIEVRRGGEVVRSIDLYDYLLRGDSRDDVRLEQGDIVFVPVVGSQIGIQGAVRRAALYELTDAEGLQHLLGYAGRLEAEALLRRVQIDRIVPPDARSPGIDRVLHDVDVQQLLNEPNELIPLRDGDLVQVFTVSGERRNRFVLTGEVRRPGVYEWAPGTSIWDAINRAEGLEDRAYTPRAHIYRLNLADGTRTLVRTPLLADASGQPLEDVPLADRDSVVIHSQADLRNDETVEIDGFVRNPGSYTLALGMTVPDLVLAAGGFIHGANVVEADIARMPDDWVRTDTTASVTRVSLLPDDSELLADGGPVSGSGGGRRDLPFWLPRADEFELRHGDRVFVRKAPGYQAMEAIQLSGQVAFPGTYMLETRQDRLTDLLERAGGLTTEAHPAGLRIVRAGHLLPTDVERAMREPSSRHNIVLETGDSVHVPEYDPTVLVTGAVAFESRVLYEPGRGLDYYINRAGGYLDNADSRRVTVTQADGERSAVGRVLIFRRKPRPLAGSAIHVPERPASAGGVDLDQLLTRTLSIASVTASLIIAIDRLR